MTTKEKSRLETVDGGEIFLRDFRGNNTAVIFRSLFVDNENRLYSSIRLTSSSSEVIVTRTSRSSVGNLHFKVMEDPHSSKNLTFSSKLENQPTCERDGTINGENSGVAADVAELAVGGPREDFATVAVEELDLLGAVCNCVVVVI
ncbi:hypothetical protein RHGRI_031521 [Rhododendron griersonianum]|uniref:Uncharacterized protein n=1 Tax=Rhododendron griersonianum TaxID=479676 RepID=A0AAV6IAL3_9ERIC|nr:hypothetical protein RHGRI_031521 [Rhododendron griersonianum]